MSLSVAALAFALLAVDSTYAIIYSETILHKTTPWLNRLGFHDLAKTKPETVTQENAKRICLLGFSWTASSLLEEVIREKPALLNDILVVDFNPQVYERLRAPQRSRCLWRHCAARCAAACRGGACRDHHLLAAQYRPERREQFEITPAIARNEPHGAN